MSLRIRRASGVEEAIAGGPPDADGWATRIAKLIPAEALGLYGAAAAMVPSPASDFSQFHRTITLWALAAVCLAFSAALRWRATRDKGKPQIVAIALALLSFLIWLVAVGPPNSPIVLPQGFGFLGPLVAMVWATVITFFYQGD